MTAGSTPAPRHRRALGPQMTEDAAAWSAVLRDLDAAPVFALVDDEGRFLQQRQRDDGQKLVLFYAEIDRALDELEAARAASSESKLQLKPVGLGGAYEAVQSGKVRKLLNLSTCARANCFHQRLFLHFSRFQAMLVPGFKEVGAAQDMQIAAPEDAAAMLESAGIESPVVKWQDDVIPVFGCFEMVRRRPDGSRFTPVFMSHSDAQAAFDKARAANPERTAKFEVDVVPLPKLLELAVAGKAKVPPRVIPPSNSMLFLQGKYNRPERPGE